MNYEENISKLLMACFYEKNINMNGLSDGLLHLAEFSICDPDSTFELSSQIHKCYEYINSIYELTVEFNSIKKSNTEEMLDNLSGFLELDNIENINE